MASLPLKQECGHDGHTFDPAAWLAALVAIGGGFSQVTPVLFDHMRTAIATRWQFGFVTKVRVVPSGLSSDGPLIGAAALVHRTEVVG